MKGSSPLTRGKPVHERLQRGHVGLIPAHAGKTQVPCSAWLLHRAHPRSRGENTRKSVRGSITAGSSPLTRGKHSARLGAAAEGGLIPAHAGKTARFTSDGSYNRAHPRSRGENLRAGWDAEAASGSSPLTRGKRLALQALTAEIGLIPAHAGKTALSWVWRSTGWAHPRSRGENTS